VIKKYKFLTAGDLDILAPGMGLGWMLCTSGSTRSKSHSPSDPILGLAAIHRFMVGSEIEEKLIMKIIM
jgi:hypothetical protein